MRNWNPSLIFPTVVGGYWTIVFFVGMICEYYSTPSSECFLVILGYGMGFFPLTVLITILFIRLLYKDWAKKEKVFLLIVFIIFALLFMFYSVPGFMNMVLR